MEQLKLEKKYLSSGISLVTNPGLFKITTIKKKHLEGIPQYHENDAGHVLTGEVDVVGQWSYKVILFHKDSNKFFFLHEMHIRKVLMAYAQDVNDGGGETTYDTAQYAHDEMEQLTQIFMD